MKTSTDYVPHPEEDGGEPARRRRSPGWFQASRYPDMRELIRTYPKAFLLAYIIAYRARWNAESFNPLNLSLGEAAIDYENWGLTEQEFRTARDKLKKWGMATFRTTNKGTIGKLLDPRLFATLPVPGNEQAIERSSSRPTNRQRNVKEQGATNQECNTNNSRRSEVSPLWKTGKVDPTK